MARPLLAALVCLAFLHPAQPAPQEQQPETQPDALPVVWYLRLEAREGREEEAWDACRRTVQYLKANYQGAEGEFYVTYVGQQPRVLHRFIEMPDVQGMSAVWSAPENDAGYKPLDERFQAATSRTNAQDLVLLATGPRREGTSSERVLRTARAKFGSMPEALRVAEELSAYMNEACDGLFARTFVQDVGEVMTIHWTIDFESIDFWHAGLFQMLRDPAYEALLKRAGEVFVEDSVRDELMERGFG